MINPNPITVAGKVYDEYALALVISPLYKTNPDFLSASVVMELTPLRRENDLIEVLHEPQYKRRLIVSDAFAETDMAFLTALGTAQYAIQNYINAVS